MPKRKPDIIIFTLFRADNPYSSISIRLAKCWAKESRVFYINPPFTYKDLWTMRHDPAMKARKRDAILGKIQYEPYHEIPENFISVIPPAIMPVNWLPEGGLYQWIWSRYNDQVIATIRQVINDHDIRDFIFFNCFNPYFAQELPADIAPLLHIYHCIDDISQEPYTARHGVRLESEAVRKADIVTVTAHQLKRIYEKENPNIHILHNAVDISTFRKATEKKLDRPKELEGIKGKIIGFTGNLDHVRIDYKLIKKVALAHPDKTLVLVGPVNSREIYELGIDQLPNVVLTGSKPHEELPGYLQHFDCALIPFLCNKLTESIYPLKINEYLAAGKAVVSTSFSEDIKSFGKYIYLAQDQEDFLRLINQAIDESNGRMFEERVNIALQNTWEARVNEFWEIAGIYRPQLKNTFASRKIQTENAGIDKK